MRLDRRKIEILICAFIGVTLTWYLNHEMGYGAIISNGLVGVLAAILLPKPLDGITYTASFVGMSCNTIIPSLLGSAIGGIIVGILLLLTTEVYKGIGGKGGTTATLSTLITRAIMSFLA